MKFKTSIGGQIDKKLTNSDLIYFNYLMYEMKTRVYTTQAQERFFEEKQREATRYKFDRNQCHSCGRFVTETGSFWGNLLPWENSIEHKQDGDSLKYCNFCMDTVTC